MLAVSQAHAACFRYACAFCGKQFVDDLYADLHMATKHVRRLNIWMHVLAEYWLYLTGVHRITQKARESALATSAP